MITKLHSLQKLHEWDFNVSPFVYYNEYMKEHTEEQLRELFRTKVVKGRRTPVKVGIRTSKLGAHKFKLPFHAPLDMTEALALAENLAKDYDVIICEFEKYPSIMNGTIWFKGPLEGFIEVKYAEEGDMHRDLEKANKENLVGYEFHRVHEIPDEALRSIVREAQDVCLLMGKPCIVEFSYHTEAWGTKNARLVFWVIRDA